MVYAAGVMATKGTRSDVNTLRATLHAKGLRATPSRLAVLGMLLEAKAPLSHGEVADLPSGGSWDRATIYRNLMDLSEAGLVRRTDVGDHVWRFEMTRAGDHATPHPHFVCTGCGAVACLPNLELAMRPGRGTPRAVKQKRVEVQLRGLCDRCA
jgi:Fur family ferric uptake transcriptional regulator